MNDAQALEGIEGRVLTQAERRRASLEYEAALRQPAEHAALRKWLARLVVLGNLITLVCLIYLVCTLIQASQALKAAGQ